MTPFEQDVKERLASNAGNRTLRAAAETFMRASLASKYSYNMFWLGRPIIQYPQDVFALQEIIWTVRPDLIIETGIAHGGSLILSASMLALLDYCDAATTGRPLDPKTSRRRVLGVDIDIRPHNRAALAAHPMIHKIYMIEGSSIALDIIKQVRHRAQGHERIMVCLDSNHTHEHVLAELRAYAPLVTQGSYCVVLDTIIEDFSEASSPDRPWGRGNNPLTAVREYLETTDRFVVDHEIANKLLITVAPRGYLRRVR